MASKEEKAKRKAEYEAKELADLAAKQSSSEEKVYYRQHGVNVEVTSPEHLAALRAADARETEEAKTEPAQPSEEEVQKILEEVSELIDESPVVKVDERTLGEQAAQVTEAVKPKGKLKLGKADLNPQEDALLREVVQLQYRGEGQSIEQKSVTQDIVDELCKYGSFLGKLGWLRAKYHESMKK